MNRSDEFFVGSAPVPEVAAGAARYRQMMGMHAPEQDYSQSVIPLSRSREIGHAYMNMPSFDERAVPAFKQMAEEVGRQYDFMTAPPRKGGMGIQVHTFSDPSEDYFNRGGDFWGPMREDVTQNGRIGVLSDRSTGGHPVFTHDQNEMFRAVHDVFGHLGAGRAGDMHGEDAAFQKHAAMFSPLARQAMATETRGQQGALHMMGDFQEQKVGVLPAHLRVPRNLSPTQFGELGAAQDDARFENARRGI